VKLAGALVLVTGASSGIGAATAREAARRGARVVLLARSAPTLADAVAGIRGAGGQADSIAVDLRDAEAVVRMAAVVKDRHGVPDAIVNNAGAGVWRFADETSPAEAVEMMAVPYFAAFSVTRVFLPAMLERRRVTIVNVTSPAAFVAWPGAAAYVAARFAMRGFTEALRSELRGTGLDVILFTCGKVSSTYWANSPGSEGRMPGLARVLPTLTPDEAARSLVRGLERDLREIVVPFGLRLLLWQHAVCPRLTQWLVDRTGYRRANR
jgi:short-subunit dehydrogenase